MQPLNYYNAVARNIKLTRVFYTLFRLKIKLRQVCFAAFKRFIKAFVYKRNIKRVYRFNILRAPSARGSRPAAAAAFPAAGKNRQAK